MTSNNYIYHKHFNLQFLMEWKIKISKFWGQISINKILMNKNPKFMKLVTYDSSQDVHPSYKKKWDILTFHKKFIFAYKFHWNNNRSKYSPF